MLGLLDGYVKLLADYFKVVTTVHGAIVNSRIKFMVRCDWMKTGQLESLMGFDLTLLRPITSSTGQVLYNVLL